MTPRATPRRRLGIALATAVVLGTIGTALFAFPWSPGTDGLAAPELSPPAAEERPTSAPPVATATASLASSSSAAPTPTTQGSPAPTGGAVPESTAASSDAVPPPAEPSRVQYWMEILTTLDAARVAAFAAADERLLSGVYTDDSTVLADEAAAIRTFAAIGGRVKGGQQVFSKVTVLGENATVAVVHFTSFVTAYTVVDDDGRVLSRRAASSPMTEEATLLNTPAGWRVSQLNPI